MHAYTITIESGGSPFDLGSFLEDLRQRFQDCQVLSYTAQKEFGVWEIQHTNGIALLRAWQVGLRVFLLWDRLSFSTGTWMVGKITTELMEHDYSFSAQACDAATLMNASRQVQGTDQP